MLLEKLLAWGQVAPDQVPKVRVSTAKGPGVEESEWMMTMLQTPAFLKLPSSNIQTLFTRIEPVVFTQGEVIIEMGAQGDYYYIVREGRCKVSRPGRPRPGRPHPQRPRPIRRRFWAGASIPRS